MCVCVNVCVCMCVYICITRTHAHKQVLSPIVHKYSYRCFIYRVPCVHTRRTQVVHWGGFAPYLLAVRLIREKIKPPTRRVGSSFYYFIRYPFRSPRPPPTPKHTSARTYTAQPPGKAITHGVDLITQSFPTIRRDYAAPFPPPCSCCVVRRRGSRKISLSSKVIAFVPKSFSLSFDAAIIRAGPVVIQKRMWYTRHSDGVYAANSVKFQRNA